jgi:hypothetical protein
LKHAVRVMLSMRQIGLPVSLSKERFSV